MIDPVNEMSEYDLVGSVGAPNSRSARSIVSQCMKTTIHNRIIQIKLKNVTAPTSGSQFAMRGPREKKTYRRLSSYIVKIQEGTWNPGS